MHPPRPLVGCAQLHPKLVVLKASDYRRDRAQTPTTTSTQLGRASGEFQASCLGSRARRTHRQAQRAAARFRIEEAWHAWPILSVGDCSLRVSLIHLLLVDIVYPAGDREPLTGSNKPLRRDRLQHRMNLRLHTSYVAIDRWHPPFIRTGGIRCRLGVGYAPKQRGARTAGMGSPPA